MAKRLRVSRAKVGARILARGEQVLFSGLGWPEIALPQGYPGEIAAIHGPGLNHVVVQWIGLEGHPESIGVGHDHDDAGRYSLAVPESDQEWAAALALAVSCNFGALAPRLP